MISFISSGYMGQKTKIRKIHKKGGKWKGLIRFLLFLTTGIILVHVLINISVGIFIQHRLDRFHLNHPHLYRIQFERTRVNLFTGSLTLKGFKMMPDPGGRKDRMKTGGHPAIWEMDVPLLKLKGIKWLGFLFDGSLDIHRIRLKNARINRLPPARNREKQTGGDIFDRQEIALSLPFKSIGVKRIVVENCMFQMTKISGSTRKTRGYECDFTIHDLSLRFRTGDDSGSIPDLGSLRCRLKDFRFTFPDRLYTLKIGEMGLSARLSRFWIKQMELIPGYKKYDFSRKLGVRKSRIHFMARWLQFNDIALEDLLTLKALKIRTLAVRDWHWEFFRDKRVPRSEMPPPKKFPQEILRNLGFLVEIDQVRLSRGDLVVEEIGRYGTDPVSVFFSDVRIHIANITNDPARLEINPILSTRTTARLMGKSRFSFQMDIPVQDEADRFTFSGRLEPFDVRELNPVLKNAQIRIESGTLDSLDFFANANRYGSAGSLKARYNGLKISMLSRVNPKKKEKMVSFFANLIILSNNPRRRKPVRIGNMAHQRTAPRSMLNLMWKSFLNGIKSSIGLKKKRDRRS